MKKTRRILLYGFGPYRQFRDNITAKIMKSLAPRPGLKKVIFPVRFHRCQFVNTLERVKPDIVLGLGQSSRLGVEVEAQAANRRRARPADQPKRISSSGPARLKTTLALKVGRGAGKSKNAGDYVCNFSMYVMLDHIRRNGLRISYGFIHIPYDYEQKKASEWVTKILGRCQRIHLKAQR
jgi:pyroglutamyl-peptidase